MKIKFKDLKEGEVFLSEDTICIKIVPRVFPVSPDLVNVIQLDNNGVCLLFLEDDVELGDKDD